MYNTNIHTYLQSCHQLSGDGPVTEDIVLDISGQVGVYAYIHICVYMTCIYEHYTRFLVCHVYTLYSTLDYT